MANKNSWDMTHIRSETSNLYNNLLIRDEQTALVGLNLC